MEEIDVIHLVRVLAAAGETDLLSDELLSRFQAAFERIARSEVGCRRYGDGALPLRSVHRSSVSP